MTKYLFGAKLFRVLAVIGAVAAAPVATASAASTTVFATAQGTAVLGQEAPLVGTQGWYITVPVGSQVAPQIVWQAIDFTVASEVTVGRMQVVNLYVDPHMAK